MASKTGDVNYKPFKPMYESYDFENLEVGYHDADPEDDPRDYESYDDEVFNIDPRVPKVSVKK